MKNYSLSLEHFVTLMLIYLARKTQIIDLRNPNKKYACIPFAYKEIIQNILYAENRWKDMFSCLINVEEYFDDHFLWENKMSIALECVLKKLGKNVECDFEKDKLLIVFTDEELNELMKKYNNRNINNRMDHFTNLLNDYIYTREFKENFHNYSAKSVEKVRLLNQKKIENF